MKLKTYLQKADERKIRELTKQHNIYYNPEFSRNWINKQVSDKIATEEYLEKLIQQRLNKDDQELLKKLTTTDSINKHSTNLSSYHNLLDYGLIYERNNFGYLFSDLKPLLKDHFSLRERKEETTNLKKFTLDSTVEVKEKKINLSFFHYLILTLAQAQKREHRQSPSLQEELLSFLDKINLSSLKTRDLYHKLLEYSNHHNLISADFRVKKEFQTWVETPYQKKILSTLNIFFPESESALRKIIAVLSHYPLKKKIPLDFAHHELQMQKMNSKAKKLLATLNTIDIEDNQITLKKESWQQFNPRVKFNFSPPQRKDNKIITASTIKLNKLWDIALQHQLIAVKSKLIFAKDNHSAK